MCHLYLIPIERPVFFLLFYYLLSNEEWGNYISPAGLFMQFVALLIFRLTHLTFGSRKQDKQVAPRGH